MMKYSIYTWDQVKALESASHYIKNHYRLIAVDLSRQKEELDADPKAIQQKKIAGQLKKNPGSMFVLTVFE